MISAILSVLLSFAISVRDQMPESPDERVARLQTIAAAIESTANRAACFEQIEPCRPILGDRYLAAAVLIVQARRESALRRDVQLGQCRAHECDRGRAISIYQIHRAPSETVNRWQNYAGQERANVESASWRILTLWAGGAYRGRAKGLQLHCGFQRLARGSGVCWSDSGKDRATETVRVAARLRAAR